jgi:hypothetical protein
MVHTLTQAKAAAMSNAASHVDEGVKRLVGENSIMLGELAFQSTIAEGLQVANAGLTAENKTLKRDNSLARGELKELFGRLTELTAALKAAKASLAAADREVAASRGGGGVAGTARSSATPRQWIKMEPVNLPGSVEGRSSAASTVRSAPTTGGGTAVPVGANEGEGPVDRASFEAALAALVTVDAQRREMLAVADESTAALLLAAAAIRRHWSALAAAGTRVEAAAVMDDAEADGAERAASGASDAVLFLEAAAALERLTGGGGTAVKAGPTLPHALTPRRLDLVTPAGGTTKGAASDPPLASRDVLAVYRFLHFLLLRVSASLGDMARAVPVVVSVESLLESGAPGRMERGLRAAAARGATTRAA